MIWLNLKIFYDKKITNFTYYMLNKGYLNVDLKS